jgi:hypothetical protein
MIVQSAYRVQSVHGSTDFASGRQMVSELEFVNATDLIAQRVVDKHIAGEFAQFVVYTFVCQ